MSRAPEPIDDRPRDPDRIDGAAHPRETERLIGQEAAETRFLEAHRAGRLHHAWMLRGAPGVGKATFAYRAARFLLSGGAIAPEGGLAAGVDAAARRRTAIGADPGLIEIRRAWDDKAKRFKTEIGVDQIRRLIEFFQLSAAEGGWRVALIDPADDLNQASANALLKLIEEPPPRTTFFLATSAPARLPTTIRSRCRLLDFRPLSAEDCAAAIQTAAPEISRTEAGALAALADGAPGAALRLHALGGLALADDVTAWLDGLPGLDRAAVERLSSSVAARDGVDRFRALGRLLRREIEARARAAARAGATAPAATLAAASFEVAERVDRALGLNLDRARAILDIALYLSAEAAKTRWRPS